MSTVNLSPLPVPQDPVSVAAGPSAELASTGFLGVLAFAVTIMLAGFAIEFVFGLLVWTFRVARRAAVAVTVTVLTLAIVAVAVTALVVSGHTA